MTGQVLTSPRQAVVAQAVAALAAELGIGAIAKARRAPPKPNACTSWAISRAWVSTTRSPNPRRRSADEVVHVL
jgi:hypothetical protein